MTIMKKIRPAALVAAVGIAVCGQPVHTMAMSLNDFVPPTEGGSVEPQQPVQESGDVVTGSNMQDSMGYAYQQIMKEGGDGVRTVKTKTGIGILATGSAGYEIWENMNATLLSKRAAYIEAFTKAQKQMVGHEQGFQNHCELGIQSNLLAIDSGESSAANSGESSSDVCKEVAEGVLSAYITYSVDDNIDEKTVSVTIASSSKTRTSLDRVGDAVIISTDPSKTFEHIATEISKGIVPPVGAKLITNPENGESIVIGFGSAIIRDNSNSSMRAKLKEVASKQAKTRANNALLSFLEGSEVYWAGGFDEKQMESSDQFEIPVDDEGNAGDPVKLDEQKNQFLNILQSSDDYSVVTSGHLPAGVQPKAFPSEDGYWMNAISVYMPSQTALAQQAAKESASARAKDVGNIKSGSGQSQRENLNSEGGLREEGVNPQGPSGRVIPDNDF